MPETFHETEPLTEDQLWKFVTEKLGSRPKSIHSPKLVAAYHKIYVIEEEQDPTGRILYLRVARPALPASKTLNEVGCMKWVKQNISSCPCPDVIAWSANTDEIGYEYVILEGMPGDDMSEIWARLPTSGIDSMIDTCAKMFVEMGQHTMDKVGGLKVDNTAAGQMLVPGPVIEEVAYESEVIEKHVPRETGLDYENLQIGGPFDTISDYLGARLQRDLTIINAHNSCVELRETLAGKIQRVLANLHTSDVQRRVNSKRLVLAHQDLHLGNMLFDQSRNKLSGVLDWEFSGVTAIDQWVRRNTFVTMSLDSPVDEWRERFFNQVKQLDPKIWEEATEVEPVKDKLNSIVSLTFWLVKCTVTGTQEEDRKRWMGILDDTISAFEALI